MREQDAWGELRSLLDQPYPSFTAIWKCLVALDGDERIAAATYTRRGLGMIAGGLSKQLDTFDAGVLEPWIERLVLGQLWRQVELFEQSPDLLDHALADLALREHVHTKHIPAEALGERRAQVRDEGTYYALGVQSEWVQGLVIAMLETHAAECARSLHQHIAQWNAMPGAQQMMVDEVRDGIGRARDTILGGGRSRGVLPSLLGGGLGISQLLGAGVSTLRDAGDSIARMGSAFSVSRDQALSEIENHMVQFCLDWIIEESTGRPSGTS